MKRRKFICINAALAPGLLFYRNLKELDVKSAEDDWQSLFQNGKDHPPYTLWQWMNGCVTKEGITYDLEAFKKAGINNVQQFLVGGSEADITDPEVTVLGDKWMELMRFALDECKRLGMTFGTHICPGWSASGAPGIAQGDSMQKLVWTNTVLRSEDSFTKEIPPFKPDPQWNFYKDICLIAVPSGSETVAKEAVLILTDNLTIQHNLNQRLPPGEWLILRFGHTTTGHINLTAPPSGQGLEVDKMSKEALEKFWALYPAKLLEMAGDHVGKTFKRFEIDSFEAGEQTWTKKMTEEFKSRCGYELLPWLPSLAGVTIREQRAYCTI